MNLILLNLSNFSISSIFIDSPCKSALTRKSLNQLFTILYELFIILFWLKHRLVYLSKCQIMRDIVDNLVYWAVWLCSLLICLGLLLLWTWLLLWLLIVSSIRWEYWKLMQIHSIIVVAKQSLLLRLWLLFFLFYFYLNFWWFDLRLFFKLVQKSIFLL